MTWGGAPPCDTFFVVVVVPATTQDPAGEFRKVFVYAPPSAGPSVNKMLKDLGLDKTWDAEPVSSGTPLRESGLTTILEAALASARSRER